MKPEYTEAFEVYYGLQQALREFSVALHTHDKDLFFLSSVDVRPIQTDIFAHSMALGLSLQYSTPESDWPLICQDPFGDNTLKNEYFLTLPLTVTSQKMKQTMYITFKVSLPLDSEALKMKIPPLLLTHEILTSMSQQSEDLKFLATKLGQAILEFRNIRERVLSIFKFLRWIPDKTHLKNYFKVTQNLGFKILQELPLSERNEKIRLSEKQTIKLKIETKEGRIRFDFSGTDLFKDYHWTSALTQSACVSATLRCLQEKFFVDHSLVLNSATLSLFEVVAQQGTIVNKKMNFQSNAEVLWAHHQILRIVTRGLNHMIGSAVKELARGEDGAWPCFLNFKFNHKALFFVVQTSSGAKKSDVNFAQTAFPSIEEIENNYPLKIESFGYRALSGGRGLINGEDAKIYIFENLEAGHLDWSVLPTLDRPQGFMGGKEGHPPEIVLHKASGTAIELTESGQISIEKGDRIVAAGYAGSGLFKPEEK